MIKTTTPSGIPGAVYFPQANWGVAVLTIALEAVNICILLTCVQKKKHAGDITCYRKLTDIVHNTNGASQHFQKNRCAFSYV